MTYPHRLIEVDLPIKRISAHARREKSIRHGHISTLHIWWARRPLAACRAVLCAALWLDPADENCPQAFRDAAALLITNFARQAATSERLSSACSAESLGRWLALAKPEARIDPTNAAHWNVLRYALLDFIADFANWDNSTVAEYLEMARLLTQVAHAALAGFKFQVSGFKLDAPDGLQSAIINLKSAIADSPRPLVVDPFAGGGAIPLEALRVGADAFASDLNPVAVLLNKVVLEYIPKYGQQLADEVRKWGQWIKEQAEKELAEYYPKDADGATPIAYLWARTITCEGPGCGAEVPLMRGLWLAKKGDRSVALQLVVKRGARGEGRVDFEIIERRNGDWVKQSNPKPHGGASQSKIKNPKFDGTVKRGSATCPVCGYTTPVTSVRKQLKARKGGAADARLFAVVTTKPNEQGRFYRLPTECDLDAARKAAKELEKRKRESSKQKAVGSSALSLVPDEPLPPQGTLGFRVQLYGMEQWGDLFTARQALALTTLARLVRDAGDKLAKEHDAGFASAVQTCLAMVADKFAQYNSSLCRWKATGENVVDTFGRQALPIVWDLAEANPLAGASGDFGALLGWHTEGLEFSVKAVGQGNGNVECTSATKHPLPDDAAHCFFSDPPYYDAVPYADLSDFFYVWLKRTLPTSTIASFADALTPKADECIVDEVKGKDRNYFEKTMAQAMAEGRRVLASDGIGVVVFAHKSTSGWEAQLQAMVDAGWTMTGSWPIDTEMGSRLRAMDSAALASSVHLVCRPRADAEANPIATRNSPLANIGDWRDVLAELPQRIHTWMPRLAQEGVVGADAIFACLGPALEIFSRYARVEKASGEQVTLKEYLEYVWAAVAKEALNMIFTGADATGFEEDARLTAMWLWTLTTNSEVGSQNSEGDEEADDDEEGKSSGGSSAYVLEFDAARKIAQGLGAHLERMTNLVEVKGDKARLLPVSERARFLFGKDEGKAPMTASAKRKQAQQLDMFKSVEEVIEEAQDWGEKNAPPPGATVLDRVHQAMILFAAGRSDALKRFLVDASRGAGNDQRFWRLAQAFSALYPASSDEKRWVDGVLARKKGLGF